jgi:hypothetical protein
MFCSFIQTQISRLLDEGGPLSKQVQKHLKRCSTCRLFYENLLQIESKLRQDNPNLPVENTAALQKRITAELRRRALFSAPPQSRRKIGFLPQAAAILLIAAVGGLFWRQYHFSRLSGLAEEINPLNRTIPSDFYPFRNSLLTNTLQHPLEVEMNKLTQDMHTAVRFVSSCLPEAPLDIEQP